MKKLVSLLSVALFISAIFFVSSCGKDVTVSYTMPEYEQCLAFQQYASSTGFVKRYTIQQADLQAAFTAASVTYVSNRITSMVARGLKLKVSGSSTTLNGLGGASVYIKTQSSTDSTQIASTSGTIADGAQEVTLALNGTDLKSMLGTEPLIVTLRLYNKDNSPAVCAKLASGTIDFGLRK